MANRDSITPPGGKRREEEVDTEVWADVRAVAAIPAGAATRDVPHPQGGLRREVEIAAGIWVPVVAQAGTV